MKRFLLDILDYLKYQLEHDKCTSQELKSIYEAIDKNLEIDASISDIAEFYKQSDANVRNVISRNYKDKSAQPKRRVMYNFAWFRKIVPKSWNKGK